MDSIKVLLSIFGSLINTFLGLFFFYLIRIFFDIEIIGYYSGILSLLSIFAFITDLGFATAQLKFYSEAKDEISKIQAMSTFSLYKLIQFSIYACIILTLIPIPGLFEIELSIVYYFFLIEFMRIIGTNYLIYVLLSEKKVTKRMVSLIIPSIIRIILLVIFVNFYYRDLWLLAHIIFLPNLIFIFILLYYLRHLKIEKPSRVYLKKYLKFSLPFFLITSSTMIAYYLDVILVGLWNSVEDVANYFTAKQLHSIFIMIFMNVSIVLIPLFSKNYKEKKDKENLYIVKKVHRLTNLLISPIILIGFVYSTPIIIFLFSDSYQSTGQILSLLLFDVLLSSINYTNRSYLEARGKIIIVAKMLIFQNLLTVFLSFILISPYIINIGIIGGAYSLVISNIITQLIWRPLFFKKYKLGFYWGFFRNFIIVLGLLVIQLIIFDLFLYPPYIIPLFMLGDFLAYFLLNIALKGIRKEDFDFLFSLIKFKNIKETIFSEFNN